MWWAYNNILMEHTAYSIIGVGESTEWRELNDKLYVFLLGVKVTEVQAMVENHLKDMILKTFDPKKADTIFTEEGEVSITINST